MSFGNDFIFHLWKRKLVFPTSSRGTNEQSCFYLLRCLKKIGSQIIRIPKHGTSNLIQGDFKLGHFGWLMLKTHYDTWCWFNRLTNLCWGHWLQIIGNEKMNLFVGLQKNGPVDEQCIWRFWDSNSFFHPFPHYLAPASKVHSPHLKMSNHQPTWLQFRGFGGFVTPNLLLQEPSNGFIFQCNFCILNLCIKPFLWVRSTKWLSLWSCFQILKPEAQHWRKRPRNWSSQNKYGSLKMCLHHSAVKKNHQNNYFLMLFLSARYCLISLKV